MLIVKNSNNKLNRYIEVEYNGNNILNSSNGTDKILFMLIIPDQSIIKIDCYCSRLDKERIIKHLSKYNDYYYILTLSCDPKKILRPSDIKFIKNRLKSNFIELLDIKNCWILIGDKKDDQTNQIDELIDPNIIKYKFPYKISNNNNLNHNIKIDLYPKHPIYNPKINNPLLVSGISNQKKFLFIGGTTENLVYFTKIKNIEHIDSQDHLDVNNVKKYLAIIVLSKTEEYVEEWNLRTIIQYIPVFSKYYKKGTIEFKDEQEVLTHLNILENNPLISHKIGYEMSKKYWDWNWDWNWDWDWKPIKKEYNIQYISVINSISGLIDILEMISDQEFNGYRYINIYTTNYLYNDLINLLNCYYCIDQKYIFIYLIKNIDLNTHISDSIDYIIYLDPKCKYTNDYTKNILHNFNLLDNTNINKSIIAKKVDGINILGSLACKTNSSSLTKFEEIIKTKNISGDISGDISSDIYSIDPYEFSF